MLTKSAEILAADLSKTMDWQKFGPEFFFPDLQNKKSKSSEFFYKMKMFGAIEIGWPKKYVD